MRICELGDGDGGLVEEEQREEKDEKARAGGQVVQLSAKLAFVGAGARVLFYPTLLYNVLRNRFEAEFRWWDRVDQGATREHALVAPQCWLHRIRSQSCGRPFGTGALMPYVVSVVKGHGHFQYILLGAVPFPSDVPRLKQLGVQGVVTLNEPYETLVPKSLYQAHGIDHLVIPTRDYLFAPSLEDICRAMDFIHRNASLGGTTYVHCKAGRGRSTSIVLCYLIKYRSMTPEAALDHVRSIRPRVLLAPSQWQAVIVFSTLTTGRLPVRSANLNCYLEASKASIADEEIDMMEFDYEDSGLPLCQVMRPKPTSSTGCIDAVFITEADLEGYDSYVDSANHVVSLEVVVSRKPIMRRLSCLFGSLRLASNCEPAPSRFTEVRAC